MQYNKQIIITGANKGIGFECIKQFCEEYTDKLIVAISRSTDNLIQLDYLNLKIIQCDVSEFEQLKSKIDNLAHDFQIEGVITCAGTAYLDDFCNIEHSANKQMLEANVVGLTNTLEAAIPHMRKGLNGTIINISSLSDRYPRPQAAVYGASKAYVKSLSDSLRMLEAKHNIRVCNLSPAFIDTPLSRNIRKNAKTKINVKDFVNIIKFMYSQPQYMCIRDLVVAPTDYEG